MKKLNQKGFTGLEVFAVIAIVWIGYTVAAPFLPKSLTGGTTQKTVQKETVTSTTKPVIVADKPIFTQNADGTFSMIQETKTVTSTSDDTTPVQAPLFQRIVAWFARLGLLGLLLALIFPGVFVGLVVWLRARWNALQTEIQNHKEDFSALEADTKKIVLGMEKAFSQIPHALASVKLPGEINLGDVANKIEDAMKNELAIFYNDSTKSVVNTILDPTSTPAKN